MADTYWIRQNQNQNLNQVSGVSMLISCMRFGFGSAKTDHLVSSWAANQTGATKQYLDSVSVRRC